MVLPEIKRLLHALSKKYDVAVLDSFSLDLIVALCKAFDPADGVVDKIVDQVLICDLLLVHHLASEAHYHLAVVDVACLHHFR